MIAELAKSPSFTFLNDEYTSTPSIETASLASSNLIGCVNPFFKVTSVDKSSYPITDTSNEYSPSSRFKNVNFPSSPDDVPLSKLPDLINILASANGRLVSLSTTKPESAD